MSTEPTFVSLSAAEFELLNKIARCADKLSDLLAEFDGDPVPCSEYIDALDDVLIKLKQHRCQHSYGADDFGCCVNCVKAFRPEGQP